MRLNGAVKAVTIVSIPFFNVNSFQLNNPGATDTLEALMAYINGFSPNAREILLRFKMEETCKKLQEKGMLYEVCHRFSTFDCKLV